MLSDAVIIAKETFQTEGIATKIAAFAAIISVIFAARSYVIAKKALLLAKRAYEDKQSNFSLYLIDSYRWTSKKDNTRKFLLFHITITNKSEIKSSYKAELEIEYIRSDSSVARAIILHDDKLQSLIPRKLSVFALDIRINEKGMESKWLIFEEPASVFNEFRIEKYSIKITDIVGNSKTVESTILKELKNG